MADLREKRLFLLDMDGTIYLDDRLFDGVTAFLERIREKGGRYDAKWLHEHVARSPPRGSSFIAR